MVRKETLAAPDEADVRHSGENELRVTEARAPDGGARSEAVTRVALDERMVELVILTATRYTGDAEPVPGVAVAVGVGTALDPNAPFLAEAVSDGHGRASVLVPQSAVVDPRSAWLRVVAPGFQQSTRMVRISSAVDSTEVRVKACRGGTVRGRLVDADGRPLAGEVSLHAFDPVRGLRYGSDGVVGPGADGWFAIHLEREATYHVLADAGDGGTAVLADVEMRFQVPPKVIELVASGPGIVRGRVIDRTQRPAAGLELLVLVAELDDGLGSQDLPEPAASQARLEGRGRQWVPLCTDANGAFEARGLLVNRRFVVHALSHYAGSDCPRLLTAEPVAADGTEQILIMHRPHLAVRLVDERGAAWHEEPDAKEYCYRGPPEAWPKQRTVVVAPIGSEAHAYDLLFPFFGGRRARGGEFVFEVPEERRFLVALIGGGSTSQQVEAWVPAGAARVEVALTAGEERIGALQVSVLDAAGKALTSNIAIEIADPSTGMPLVRKDFFNDATWPARFDLPEGLYRVVVEGVPFIEHQHGVMISPSKHGRFETEVRIERGQERSLQAVLPAGARLRLHLSGTPNESDHAAVQRWSTDEDKRRNYASLAEMMLVPQPSPVARWPQHARFTVDVSGSSAEKHCIPYLLLGSDETSQLLPAGAWLIEARLPGGRVVSTPIVLTDGQTTEARLAFE